MKKVLRVLAVLAFSIFFIPSNTFGKKVEKEIAQIVASNWYQHYAPASKQQAIITKVKEYKWGNRTSFYICSFDKGGFVLVSANDAVTPILGYGFEHTVPDEITNEAVKGWFDGYAQQIDTTFVLNLKNDEMAVIWQNVLENKFAKENGKSVEPLLTTTWDQGCYYNEMCPSDANGQCGRTWVGCTATAMAQIIKYWNYPEGGVGMHSYIPRNNSQYGQQTVFFNETNYDWSAMPNNVSSENNAVATLMYHAGVSAEMDYGADASGAHLYKALIGFKNNFDYSDSISQIYRHQFTDSLWSYTLQNSINLGRPVFMDGYNEPYSNGHAFVCDGYDSQNFFHINWGWSGNSNGYWNLNNLTPGWFDFSYHQTAIINIFPNNSQLTSRFYSNRTDTNYQIQFIDNSLGNPDSFIWYFGDSTSSTSQNPYHIYADTGNYFVKLIVEKNNIYDTIQKWINIYRDPFLLTNTSLAGNDSKIMAVDYNIDGQQDVFISGHGGQHLYKNNNTDFIESQMDFSSVQLSPSHIKSADIINDGYPDILLVGQNSYNVSLDFLFYLKNKNGLLVLDTLQNIPLNIDDPFSFTDYNNDGKTDILIGNKLYRNIGNKKFIFQALIGNDPVVSSWADYDQDGDLDVAIGSKIFRNDGNNIFIDIGFVFPNTTYWWYSYNMSWGDFDHDGLPDLLAGGSVIKNLGNDSFQVNALNLNAYNYFNIYSNWGDIDNDGDLDVIVSGSGSNSDSTNPGGWNCYSTEILLNTNGIFTSTNSNIKGFLWNGSTNWIDYDQDNSLDLLFTGFYPNDSTGMGVNLASNIYKNNSITDNSRPISPQGLISFATGNSVNLSWNRSIDDFTTSNSLTYNIRVGTTPLGCDIYSPMSDSISGRRHVMARGNTCQDTSWKINNLINGKYYWSVQSLDNSYIASEFSVIDSFYIAGNNIAPELIHISKEVFLNTPINLSLQNLLMAYYDPENDSLQAIRIDSLPANGILTYNGIPVVLNQAIQINNFENLCYTTNNFTNDYFYICPYDGNSWGLSSSKFELTVLLFEKQNIQLSNELKIFAWGDYDKDGDIDLASENKIFKNINGNFQDIGIALSGNGDVNWGDIDSDGDLDLAIGEKIFKNEGNDQFNNWQLLSPALDESASSFGDLNSNNRIDYLYAGSDFSNNIFTSKIFVNQELRDYSDSAINILGFRSGAVDWGDFDNDGDQDIAVSGIYDFNNNRKTIIYRNDNGQFIDIQAGLPEVNVGTLDWGDYDNDGDLDLLICGSQGTLYDAITRIYQNNNGVFEDFNSGFIPGLFRGFAKWVDVDTDGFLDIILNGFIDYPIKEVRLFKNINGISFTEISRTGLPDLAYVSCAIGDFNNDGFPDFIMSGINEQNETITSIYRNCYGNETVIVNSPPNVPTNLQSIQAQDGVNLQWDKSTDNTTPQNTLSYNIYIRRQSDSLFICSPMADLETGFRKLAQPGNTSLNNFWHIDSLPPGTYYWSVQAIDNSFAGSPFAPESTFTILPCYIHDFDCDCDVDIIDVTSAAYHYGLQSGDSEYDPQFDLDNDGDIDLIDITMVAYDYGWNCDSKSQLKHPLVNIENTNVILHIEEQTLDDGFLYYDLMIEDVQELGGFEFELEYNPNELEIIEIQDLGFLGSTGRQIMELENNINNGTGMLNYTLTTLGAQTKGASGSGTLFRIKCKAHSSNFSPPNLVAGQIVRIDAEPIPFEMISTGVSEESMVVESNRIISVSPNPFSDHSVIEFYIAKKADVKLQMMDVFGRVYWESTPHNYYQGFYKQELKRNDNTNNAVYTIILITNGMIQDKAKIILTK